MKILHLVEQLRASIKELQDNQKEKPPEEPQISSGFTYYDSDPIHALNAIQHEAMKLYDQLLKVQQKYIDNDHDDY